MREDLSKEELLKISKLNINKLKLKYSNALIRFKIKIRINYQAFDFITFLLSSYPSISIL